MSDRLLEDAAVQRVDVGPLVAVLRLRAPGETTYVILAAGRRGAVGLLSSRPWSGAGLPGGSAADGEKARFRARLEGARVEALGARWILLRKGEARFALEAGSGEGSRVTLRELPPDEALGVGEARTEDDEALRAEGVRITRELGADALATRKV